MIDFPVGDKNGKQLHHSYCTVITPFSFFTKKPLSFKEFSIFCCSMPLIILEIYIWLNIIQCEEKSVELVGSVFVFSNAVNALPDLTDSIFFISVKIFANC